MEGSPSKGGMIFLFDNASWHSLDTIIDLKIDNLSCMVDLLSRIRVIFV